MSELPQDVTVVVPVEPRADPLATGVPGVADALAVPRGGAPGSTGETVTVEISLAGKPFSFELHPNAVLRMVVHRYCAGGWRAVYALRDAINTSLATASAQAFPAPRAGGELPPPSESDKLAVSRAVAFAKKTAGAIETLEMLVRAVLVQAAIDALGVSRERIPQVRARFEAARDRYKIKATEVDLGPTDIKPAVENAYRDRPKVQVEGSQDEAHSLARAVKDLSVLHRNLVWTRIEVYAPQTELSRESSPRPDNVPTPTPDPAGDERIKQAKALLDFLGNPGGHTFAAPVFALLKGKGETVAAIGNRSYEEIIASEEITKEIWSTAYAYIRDTLDLLEHLLPEKDEDYPLDALDERLGISLDAMSVARPPGTIDSPELRAAYWSAQRARVIGYEPFDDEALLTHLANEAADRMRAADRAPDDLPDSPVTSLFALRVLTELIAARDTADRIFALAEKTEAASDATLNRVAGVLGVLGLLFPPVRIAGAGLGLYLLAGSAIATVRDVEEQQQLNEAFGLSALLDSKEAAYAESLVLRPSIAEALLPLVGQMALAELVGRSDREVGELLALFTDLEAIAPSVDDLEELADWLVEDN